MDPWKFEQRNKRARWTFGILYDLLGEPSNYTFPEQLNQSRYLPISIVFTGFID